MSIAECPRCGWNRARSTDSAHLLPHSAHDLVLSPDEITLLEDQVRRLDAEIVRLNENRVAILRKINGTRSTTRNLPPEILSTIFQFVSPPLDFVPPFSSDEMRKGEPPCNEDELVQCNMASVSQTWRQAAISTPQLWTSLSLRIHPCFSRSSLELLEMFSEKVPNFPMSVELDFREQDLPWPRNHEECLNLMEPIEDGVFDALADRIQQLRLIQPPSEWLPHLDSLSRCDTLAVVRPTPDEDHLAIDLTALPCLRHVVLIRPLYTFLLPRSSITTLHLSGISCITSMELLINCPNLVEFESYSPAFCRRGVDAAPNAAVINEPITLKQLEYLTWSTMSCDCLPMIQQYIGCVRFYKLRALQWHGHDRCYTSTEGRDQCRYFFSNLPITLTSLTFDRFSHASPLKELLSFVPNLRELSFTNCRVVFAEAVINAIGRPFIPPSENDQQQEACPELPRVPDQTLLPHLSRLSVESSFYEKLNGHVFVDLVEALRALGEDIKQFELVLNNSVLWNIDSLSRLRALGVFGFSVDGV